jgi:hypothetical protein
MFLNSYIIERMTRDRVEEAQRQAEKSRLARQIRKHSRCVSVACHVEVEKSGNIVPSEALPRDMLEGNS